MRQVLGSAGPTRFLAPALRGCDKGRPLSVSDQAHVERHRLVPAYFDLARERLIPLFSDVEPVTPFRQRHHQAFVARWTAPMFAVDEQVGIGGLDTDDQRATARRLFRSGWRW